MDYQKLSKELSYALRHAPHEYELELNEYGWVDIQQILYSLQEQHLWRHLNESDLHTMIAQSEKKRATRAALSWNSKKVRRCDYEARACSKRKTIRPSF